MTNSNICCCIIVLIILIVTYGSFSSKTKENFGEYNIIMGGAYLGRNKFFTNNKKDAIIVSFNTYKDLMTIMKTDDHYVRYLRLNRASVEVEWDEFRKIIEQEYKWQYEKCFNGFILKTSISDNDFYLTRTEDNKLSWTMDRDKSYTLLFRGV